MRMEMAAAWLMLASGDAGAAQQPAATEQARSPLVAEAQAFMAAYARDLRAGDRAAISQRYDPRGALIQGNGTSRMETAASTRAFYLSDQWHPLASFEWRDLHYEPLGPDAITVAGIFLYDDSANRPRIVSYTALLVRREGRLRIRIEHESAAPLPP